MKFIYIEATYPEKIILPEDVLKILPGHVALFTTVQFINQLQDIKAQLEKAGKHVLLFKTRNTRYEGQLYGCNIDEFKGTFDAFLFVGDGNFHPHALVLKNDKPVIVYDPKTRKHRMLDEKSVDEQRRKQKGALLTFFSSTNIGVLVSTKPGQNHYKQALTLKERYPNKHFTFIAFNTMDFASLEDFPFIECFVNTACPRIAYDDANKFTKAVINLSDVLEQKLFK